VRDINLIVIHCTASPNGKPVSIETIRAWHKARGFNDVGYHYVINVDGNVMNGRPEEIAGAHAKGFNLHSIGVSLVGGTGGPDKQNPGAYSPEQLDALRIVVRDLLIRFPGSKVKGHRDLSPDLDGDGEIEPSEWIKLCPSFDVMKWIQGGMSRHL
jgi:N-acetylmuramoyl-L-alanine amidase